MNKCMLLFEFIKTIFGFLTQSAKRNSQYHHATQDTDYKILTISHTNSDTSNQLHQ